MKTFQKRKYLYFLGILVLFAIAIGLKEVWHKGGSTTYFYIGALIFGLVMTGYGVGMTFFPIRLLAFFGRHETSAAPLWRRAELLSAGVITLLVGGITLAMLGYNLWRCLVFGICYPIFE